jgi:hypothetical protein
MGQIGASKEAKSAPCGERKFGLPTKSAAAVYENAECDYIRHTCGAFRARVHHARDLQ